MKTVLTATFLVLAGAAPAWGEQAIVGLQTGFTVPVGDFGDGADPGYSLGIFLTGPVTGPVSWRVEVGWDRAGTADEVEAACIAIGFICENTTIKRFNFGAQYTFPEIWIDWFPYTYVMTGVYNPEFSQENLFGTDLSRSSVDWGLNFGGGLMFQWSDRIGFGFDLRWSGIFSQDNDRWYLVPSGFVAASF